MIRILAVEIQRQNNRPAGFSHNPVALARPACPSQALKRHHDNAQ